MYYKQIKGGKWRAYKDVNGKAKQVKSCCVSARSGESIVCYASDKKYHCFNHNPQSLVAEIKPSLDQFKPCVASPEALKAGLPIVDLKPHFKRVADNKAAPVTFADTLAASEAMLASKVADNKDAPVAFGDITFGDMLAGASATDMPVDKIIRLSPTGVYSETTKAAIEQARLDSPSAVNRLLWWGAGVASVAYVVYAVVKAATAIGGM